MLLVGLCCAAPRASDQVGAVCEDHRYDCSFLASTHGCECLDGSACEWETFVKSECPKSCGVCTGPTSQPEVTTKPNPVCIDHRYDCSYLASTGGCECLSGSGDCAWESFVVNECPKSCGVCHEPTSQPEVTTEMCFDYREDCDFLVSSKGCRCRPGSFNCEWTAFVYNSCPRSCGVCGDAGGNGGNGGNGGGGNSTSSEEGSSEEGGVSSSEECMNAWPFNYNCTDSSEETSSSEEGPDCVGSTCPDTTTDAITTALPTFDLGW